MKLIISFVIVLVVVVILVGASAQNYQAGYGLMFTGSGPNIELDVNPPKILFRRDPPKSSGGCDPYRQGAFVTDQSYLYICVSDPDDPTILSHWVRIPVQTDWK